MMLNLKVIALVLILLCLRAAKFVNGLKEYEAIFSLQGTLQLLSNNHEVISSYLSRQERVIIESEIKNFNDEATLTRTMPFPEILEIPTAVDIKFIGKTI